MSVIRVAASTLSCHSCRASIIRSFATTTLPSSSIVPRASWTSSIPSHPRPRRFSSSTLRRNNKPSTNSIDADPSISSNLEDAPSTTPSPPSSASAAPPIPWYLQNRQGPTAQQEAIIPDLPTNPPPLLKPLLEHISLNLGLDDLILLDLRHLDPPPALGPKLIMIIGTARSEKHLHVSADRFCRWLRREHNLRPSPAGLLGRNELKIKLRRKAKRMKMLANIGGKEEGNLDDGIRTGWICCTVGRLEAHSEDTYVPGIGEDEEGFVGFREISTGVNVVVQMFTEEKRGEIDLETLWGGVLRTHERENRKADEALRETGADGVEEGDMVQSREPSSREQRTVSSPLNPPISTPPSNPSPPGFMDSSAQRWNKPTPSSGDVFPPASNSNSPSRIQTRPRQRRLEK